MSDMDLLVMGIGFIIVFPIIVHVDKKAERGNKNNLDV